MNLPLTLLLIINTFLCLTPITAQETSLSRNGCQEKCGDITIPYPFGIGPNCSFNSSYAIECNSQSKPFLKSMKLEAIDFLLSDNTVRVMQKVTPLNCSSKKGQFQLGQSLINSPFTYGASINRVILVGCRSGVSLVGPAASSGGCTPTCGDAAAGCFGINCCSVIVPEMSQRVEVAYTVAEGGGGGVCGYAFLADFIWLSREYEGYVNFSTPVAEMAALRSVPVTLEWRFDVDQGSPRGVVCENRSVEQHTFDDNVYRFNLTRCRCREGFEGNPYLSCVDIDECRNSSLINICGFGSDCVNTDGSFICKNRSDDSGMKSMIIGIGSAMGVLVLLGGVWGLSKLIKNMIRANRRKRFFERNGGLLLEQRLSSAGGGGAGKIKFFDSTELDRATDGYDEDRILGRGGQGTVYKGMLRDGQIVAVKKAKRIGEVEEFVNEVVIMSQINHRNVLTLQGCCLETETPLLVYEFIPNGTLSEHIHVRNKDFPLSWGMRVRIAAEVAGALSYLHNSAASPIYHRDIKSTNILLDGKYRAKVSDFGISRSVGVDQTHLTTRVFGTFGYLDPQYFWSSRFTEKSDVYSFGVVVVEILTGEKAISEAGVESGRNLAADFLQSMDENRLFDIVDPEVVKGRVDEVVIMAELARRCLNPSGERRPTMKEVATELEGIRTMEECLTLPSHREETNLQSIDFEDCVFSSISDSTSLIAITPNSSQVFLRESKAN